MNNIQNANCVVDCCLVSTDSFQLLQPTMPEGPQNPRITLLHVLYLMAREGINRIKQYGAPECILGGFRRYHRWYDGWKPTVQSS